jgi:hypothetical protein
MGFTLFARVSAVAFAMGLFIWFHPALCNAEDASLPASEKDPADGPDLLKRVTDAIGKNYEPLKTAEGTYEEVTSSLMQLKPAPPPNQPPQGKNQGVLTWSETQAVDVRRNDFKLKGDSLRSDETERKNDHWTQTQSIVFHGDDVTWLHMDGPGPNKLQASGGPRSRMGGHEPFDPRNFGWGDDHYELLDNLKRSKVVQVYSREPILQIRTEIVDAPQGYYKKGQQFSFGFDSTKNFLPTMMIRHSDDGRIGNFYEFFYDEVIPGKTWFVREVVWKSFLKGTTSVKSNQWDQMDAIRLVGELKVNHPIDDDAFELKFPPGTDTSSMPDKR